MPVRLQTFRWKLKLAVIWPSRALERQQHSIHLITKDAVRCFGTRREKNFDGWRLQPNAYLKQLLEYPQASSCSCTNSRLSERYVNHRRWMYSASQFSGGDNLESQSLAAYWRTEFGKSQECSPVVCVRVCQIYYASNSSCIEETISSKQPFSVLCTPCTLSLAAH